MFGKEKQQQESTSCVTSQKEIKVSSYRQVQYATWIDESHGIFEQNERQKNKRQSNHTTKRIQKREEKKFLMASKETFEVHFSTT
ncbi:CLUMA_CG008347, isoform A [Clunio marinus]|uniref:CLUMA_CG008347, isoform A n=1 Tax=Clunio marinus TaxID=568069 RepID=A0A1J1I3E2_9DIPT|nr:CLUMA_CG008347, isoform A [Clunio marinus]